MTCASVVNAAKRVVNAEILIIIMMVIIIIIITTITIMLYPCRICGNDDSVPPNPFFFGGP